MRDTPDTRRRRRRRKKGSKLSFYSKKRGGGPEVSSQEIEYVQQCVWFTLTLCHDIVTQSTTASESITPHRVFAEFFLNFIETVKQRQLQKLRSSRVFLHGGSSLRPNLSNAAKYVLYVCFIALAFILNFEAIPTEANTFQTKDFINQLNTVYQGNPEITLNVYNDAGTCWLNSLMAVLTFGKIPDKLPDAFFDDIQKSLKKTKSSVTDINEGFEFAGNNLPAAVPSRPFRSLNKTRPNDYLIHNLKLHNYHLEDRNPDDELVVFMARIEGHALNLIYHRQREKICLWDANWLYANRKTSALRKKSILCQEGFFNETEINQIGREIVDVENEEKFLNVLSKIYSIETPESAYAASNSLAVGSVNDMIRFYEETRLYVKWTLDSISKNIIKNANPDLAPYLQVVDTNRSTKEHWVRIETDVRSKDSLETYRSQFQFNDALPFKHITYQMLGDKLAYLKLLKDYVNNKSTQTLDLTPEAEQAMHYLINETDHDLSNHQMASWLTKYYINAKSKKGGGPQRT